MSKRTIVGGLVLLLLAFGGGYEYRKSAEVAKVDTVRVPIEIPVPPVTVAQAEVETKPLPPDSSAIHGAIAKWEGLQTENDSLKAFIYARLSPVEFHVKKNGFTVDGLFDRLNGHLDTLNVSHEPMKAEMVIVHESVFIEPTFWDKAEYAIVGAAITGVIVLAQSLR